MLLNFGAFLRAVFPIITLISAMILVVSPGIAQDAGQASGAVTGEAPLKVGVWVSPPFVMQTADGYTGMAIELWEELAAARVSVRALPQCAGLDRRDCGGANRCCDLEPDHHQGAFGKNGFHPALV